MDRPESILSAQIKFFAVGFISICFFAAWAMPYHIDKHAAIHSSGTVSASGIMIDQETSKTVRVLSKSVYLPPVRRASFYFYIHVELPDASPPAVEWKPAYTLWCYPANANLAQETPFFALPLSVLDVPKEGTYKIDIHVRVPVPEELVPISTEGKAGNKCILSEEGSVARSELRWELHLVPEWRWVNLFPRWLVDEWYRAAAIMGVSYEAPPGRGSTWHDGTDMPNGIEIHRRRTIEAFMQAVDAGAFINRTFERAKKR